jgi:hypothetical protein
MFAKKTRRAPIMSLQCTPIVDMHNFHHHAQVGLAKGLM